MSGIVRNANTGLPVFAAQETLTPTSGERNPGPSGFSAFGLFVWNALDPGSYQLGVASGRYLTPGPFPVTKNLGPTGFSDGSSVSFGSSLDIQLLSAVQ